MSESVTGWTDERGEPLPACPVCGLIAPLEYRGLCSQECARVFFLTHGGLSPAGLELRNRVNGWR
jgi:hypothetical protein